MSSKWGVNIERERHTTLREDGQTGVQDIDLVLLFVAFGPGAFVGSQLCLKGLSVIVEGGYGFHLYGIDRGKGYLN